MKKVKRFLTAFLCVCILAGVTAPVAQATTILTIINLTVTAPAVGKTPADTTASVPSHAHSVVKKLEWSGNFDSNGAFKAGEKYTATVTMGIKAGEDWKFSDNVTMSVKVNEKAADKIWYINDKELEVVYTFPKLAGSQTAQTPQSSQSSAVVREANITLTAPETGKTPATTATVPSGADYFVKKVEWKGSLSSGKFKANTSYTANVTLGIKSGKNAVFSDDTFDAYVNGYLIDEIAWKSGSEIVVPVEFEKTGAAQSSSGSPNGTAITKIQLTVTAPVWGKKPSTAASVSSTANSMVQSVKWSGELDTDGTFMPRVKYTVTVTMGVKAGSNHYFSDKSINATVNGKTAAEVRWYSWDKVEVIYTFPETNTGTTGIISVAKLTIDGPAAGEKPASTAHIASTASTYVKSVRWEGALDSSGRFQAGTEYTAYVTLGMKDNGRKFSDKTFDAYVNGVLMDEVTRISDTELIVPVEFEKTPGTAPSSTSSGTIPASGIAYANTQMVELDGKKVEFQMYALRDATGGETNYIKVRDLAMALNGTKAQFSVDWNGSVNLVAGETYTSNGSENSTPFSGNRSYTVPSNPTNVNGVASDLSAIVLTDDNGGDYTYYQLRDLGRKLGFNVGWSAEKGVYIESGKPYIG